MYQSGESMEADVIAEFLNRRSGSGSGSGSGYGDGSGAGAGDGYGYGSGDGYGYGDGSGDGDGYGYGYGDGSGSGDGSGYGSGSGSGSGYGSGSGLKKIFAVNGVRAVPRIDNVPTVLIRAHGNLARGFIVQDDLQLIPCYVTKGGGHFAHGETIEDARHALEEKILDNLPTEEKIEEFLKRFQPGQDYPAHEFYDWHHFLTGSCEMGRKQFAKEHGIDIEEDQLTPEAFMDLTKDDYGGSVIQKLMEAWEEAYPKNDL